jgi:fatty acid desaturase
MAHHQFVNDPERDPDVSQLKTSGHWLKFPLEASVFVWTIIRQLWIPNLIRYIRIRAMYNAMGTDKNPYVKKGVVRSKLPVRVGLAYLALSAAAFTWTVWSGNTLLLAVIPGALYVGMMIFFSVMPAELFQQTRIKPVFSPRAMTLMRMTFFTALFAALAWTTHLTGQWAAVRFLAWWVAPMLTSFSFFMILRQLVQHGNADRGWLTNTRVFDVNPLIRCAVFPMGQDYHLPHHMFASVPHYRLKDLHEAMLKYPEYAHDAVVVEGYFLPKHRPPTAPTVLDVVGPNYAGRKDRDVFIDHSVVDESRTDDLEGIRAEERSSRLGL